MEYVVNNTRNLSAYELAGAAGICKAFMLLADNLGKETNHFGESLNALFDIHISAANDPYGMFRTSGPIRIRNERLQAPEMSASLAMHV